MKSLKPSILLSVCLLASTGCAHAPPAAESNTIIGNDRYAQMRRRIDEYLIEAKADAEKRYAAKEAFSGAVLVAVGGEVVFSKAYGYANREWRIPATIDTKFRLWSITKIFTATAIMQLHEQGKLDIDLAIDRYLDRCPQAWKTITVRQLLSHTSGLPKMEEELDRGAAHRNLYRTQVTPAEMLERQRHKPLQFKPGTRFAYSNFGFLVAGVLIEKVAGKPYEEVLEESIFRPLGMAHTGLDRPETILAKRVSYYQDDLTREQRLNGLADPDAVLTLINDEYYDLPSWMFSAGALYSTLEDLLKFSSALSTGTLLSQRTLAQMWTPGDAPYYVPPGVDQAHAARLKARKPEYGLGWETHDVAGRRCFSHMGAGRSASMWFMYFPDERVTIIILPNSSGMGAGGIDRLPSIVFGESGPPSGHR